jgi:hypothetical protein
MKCRETIQKKICDLRRPRRPWARMRGARDVWRATARTRQAAGEHRRRHRLKIRLAGEVNIE